MRSITAEELPEWFKLSRYEKLEQLELRDWLPNLAIRAQYLSGFRSPAEHRNVIEDMFREDGKLSLIFDFSDGDIPESMKPNILDPAKSLKTLTVKSLRARYVAWIFNNISHGEDELSRKVAEAAEYLKPDNEDRHKESNEDLEKFLDRPFDLLVKNHVKDYATSKARGRLRVEVDLEAPDKVIIDDFSRWLAAARSEFDLPAQKFFTEAKRDDLVTYRVLPYLDLTLWAALEQVTIEHAVMAEALFPHGGVDTPYRVRRVTKPKAEWAIQGTVLQALYKQIIS